MQLKTDFSWLHRGKPSTIKASPGLLTPDDGTIAVFGQPAGTPETRARIGYLPETLSLYGRPQRLGIAQALLGKPDLPPVPQRETVAPSHGKAM
jgi:ABC-type multidrug transport system ATPase subunit